jgi:uncharacterized protein (TIGR02646 family)
MRFIQQLDVQVRLPNDWNNQVKEAKKSVVAKVRETAREAHRQGKTGDTFRNAVCKAAHKAIDDCSAVWSNAKTALAAVSFDKCWYCECKQERSDLHVDHFRPKGRVTGEKDHAGYWWLAFDWRNFRLACTFCNCIREDSETDESGGKGTKFPIFDPPPRMRRPLDQPDRTRLLDPVIRVDVEKLTFTRNGLPAPITTDEASEDWERVEETIEVFHLRETRLKRAREELATEIDGEVLVADRCYRSGDMTSFTTMADKLISRIRLDAKYATFARIILRCHRDKDWVETLWSHL